MMRQPFMTNFILEVPDASNPAVLMWCDNSAAGIIISALLTQ
jgi:hypothetical protein